MVGHGLAKRHHTGHAHATRMRWFLVRGGGLVQRPHAVPHPARTCSRHAGNLGAGCASRLVEDNRGSDADLHTPRTLIKHVSRYTMRRHARVGTGSRTVMDDSQWTISSDGSAAMTFGHRAAR